MQSAYYQQPFSAILYDADQLPRPNPEWMRAEHWPQAELLAGGRGAAWRIDTQWGTAVLKHYRRGGLMAKVNQASYWFNGWQNTRALREWRLLAQMFDAGLPVPKPWFAIAQRRGRWYRCAIVSGFLESSRSLWSLPPAQLLDASLWQNVGALVRQFCDAGIMHPDLNLGNILLDARQGLSMIDFDRARHVEGLSLPAQKMQQRLLRSYQRYQRAHADNAQVDWLQPEQLLGWMQ
jgi:3-deoxy-D-manno-octulosonic acid kinase